MKGGEQRTLAQLRGFGGLERTRNKKVKKELGDPPEDTAGSACFVPVA
jgi:hypothetical protein